MTPPLSDVVARMRELLARATPGEWCARLLSKYGVGESWGAYRSADPNDTRQVFRTMSSHRGRDDAQLLVELHNHADVLLAACERVGELEAGLKTAREALEAVDYQRMEHVADCNYETAHADADYVIRCNCKVEKVYRALSVVSRLADAIAGGQK